MDYSFLEGFDYRNKQIIYSVLDEVFEGKDSHVTRIGLEKLVKNMAGLMANHDFVVGALTGNKVYLAQEEPPPNQQISDFDEMISKVTAISLNVSYCLIAHNRDKEPPEELARHVQSSLIVFIGYIRQYGSDLIEGKRIPAFDMSQVIMPPDPRSN